VTLALVRIRQPNGLVAMLLRTDFDHAQRGPFYGPATILNPAAMAFERAMSSLSMISRYSF
jgi:hypothetical protein